MSTADRNAGERRTPDQGGLGGWLINDRQRPRKEPTRRMGAMSDLGGILRHRVHFLREYIASPRSVGSIAPSSQRLAQALCEPYRAAKDSVRVLEVGAGTGAVTRYLGRILKAGDRLDVCEVSPTFVEALRRDVLTEPALASAAAQGRVHVIAQPVQTLEEQAAYDYIISGLPLTAFEAGDVRDVLACIRRLLRPSGVFSYFEYVALRPFMRTFAFGSARRRIREVSEVLNQSIRAHQFSRRTVFLNLPPAYARHWRFEQVGGP